ncbi:MAG: hypothetical protein Q9208_006393 [Pyrenodesmia sp. 3 TL-2023]
MPDKAKPRAPQMMSINGLQDRVWDLEDELEDAKATIQSQAAQIEVHVAQVRRLRAEIRAKERENRDIGIQPTAAKSIFKTEQAVKTVELDKKPAFSHEADDIREHIIEVSDSRTNTINYLTRVERAGPERNKALDESDKVLTQAKLIFSKLRSVTLLTLLQLSSTQPFHHTDPIGPSHGAGHGVTGAGFSPDSAFSTTTPPPAPTFPPTRDQVPGVGSRRRQRRRELKKRLRLLADASTPTSPAPSAPN